MTRSSRQLIVASLLLGVMMFLVSRGQTEYALPPVSSRPNASPAVTIEKKLDLYYDVVMDYTDRTHREMGKALAQSIVQTVPEYEAIADSLLDDQFTLLLRHYPGPEFPTALERARAILHNVPPAYVDEIQGMQEVFNGDTDRLGDGKLSANELLVLQFFQDVLRPTQCSASAAFGTSSATGKTILGRNLDWDALPHNDASRLHAVTTLKNADKTLVMIHFLGTLSPNTLFSAHRIFGALLDAETGAPYPKDLATKHSYPFDLRYALETTNTLEAAAQDLAAKDYAFNHLVFLADEKNAAVLEQDLDSPGRGLRRADSDLRPGLSWGIAEAVATVNDFRLPGNHFVEGDPSDTNRWHSFKGLYRARLARAPIDLEQMKGIAGFSGTDGNAHSSGALFLSNTIVTLQSIALRMDTLELWVHFSPAGTGLMPLNPTYIRVPTRLETAQRP